jgi:hypothetical protein
VHEATGIRPDILPLTPDRMADWLDTRDGVQS